MTKQAYSLNVEMLRQLRTVFDSVEFPAMTLVDMTEQEFDSLLNTLERLEFRCDNVCNAIPATLPLMGKLDEDALRGYLNVLFDRCAKMQVKGIVFGSGKARNLGVGQDFEYGCRRMKYVIDEWLLPYLVKHDMRVYIEPLRAVNCNFVNSLAEADQIVRICEGNQRVGIVADSFNLLGQQTEEILKYKDKIWHLHVSEDERIAPEEGKVSNYLTEFLTYFKQMNYAHDYSLECRFSSL